MYVRIAKFEGVGGDWDERIETVRKRMTGGDEASPMDEVRGAVKRGMMLVDRDNGRGASVIFCETREDIDRVDAAMNQMTPPAGGGTRSAVEVYEVAVDEQPGG